MAEKKQYYKAGLVASAALIALSGVYFSQPLWNAHKADSPHYRENACGVCHDSRPQTCVAASNCLTCHGSLDPKYFVLKTVEVQLCTSCHEREGDLKVRNAEGVEVNVDLGTSHPWGLTPSVKSYPQSLPLNMGRITCQTCHDVHLTNMESHMLRLYKPQASGEADFTPLCHDCHVGY